MGAELGQPLWVVRVWARAGAGGEALARCIEGVLW